VYDVPRRQFLARSAAIGGALWRMCDDASAQPGSDLAGARLVRTVPLGRFDGRPAPRLGTLHGTGLDARQFTDLSGLTHESLVTPSDRFFIRTAAPTEADTSPWRLRVEGQVRRPIALTLASLARFDRDMGTHLIECAGNTDPANFGLMSAARWGGVPIGPVLDLAPARPGSWRIRVVGVDAASPSRSSVAGASWIFSREELERAGAFLATKMNGASLPRDHGFPLRLVVPGWYGCASIKWVARIELVRDDEPATSQMQEFASRTHQDGLPALARDYAPPLVDVAATAVRVEQWMKAGQPFYRVVGVVWGGTTAARALQIRFKYTEPFSPVQQYEPPSSTTTWRLWSHTWRPAAQGRYQIVLRADDPAIRTRRLDAYFYTREVEVDAV